mmetsp:Transcript_119/g.191  ORF Transcript_119/g.191 Transcript_119/m.191 type:complete len:200 (+) Transcript_119:85-684(+)|eukprot:CAMPEP_0119023634 /NCGR_PEP_ID=MMETSP1176-20130426/30334_1 /TAXON_ID=265551 /ORGANISM="Synedropsis recta cf, Strain CCMP1620" /LENGTH=199 /DNA_ID=CAMNT_0006978735 /DNA_START=74 /DNA_END=673 /DNA_ORIENTATION=-
MFGDCSSLGLFTDSIHQEVIRNLYQADFTGLGLPVVLDLRGVSSSELVLRGGSQEHQAALFEDVFESHPSIDFSDNEAQARVIKHHYLNEFGKHLSLSEVLKDYSEDVVIHKVVDGTPATYKGRDGVRQVFRDMFHTIPHDTSHFKFDHMAINHNHAQIVWSADTPAQGVIRGTDSFTFDVDNRIKHQTIVALTCETQE